VLILKSIKHTTLSLLHCQTFNVSLLLKRCQNIGRKQDFIINVVVISWFVVSDLQTNVIDSTQKC